MILFVCTGNLCRSPMAEYLLRKRLGNDSEWEVASAGTATVDGLPASERAVEAMKEKGIDMSGHVARCVTMGHVRSAAFVIAMATQHRDELLRRFPEAEGKVFLLKSVGTAPGADVADPIGMSLDTYRSTRDEIDADLADLTIFLHERGRV